MANSGRPLAANARYLIGVTIYFDVLDAKRQLLDSEITLSRTTRFVHQSVVQRYRALGAVGTPARPEEPSCQRRLFGLRLFS